MARTAGSCVGVVGTRSSSRSARRPSCARAPLESTIRRPLLLLAWSPRAGDVGPRFRAVRTHPARPAAAECPAPSSGAPEEEGYPDPRAGQTPGHTRGERGCSRLGAAVRWPEMNASQESPRSGPEPVDDAGGVELVAALETASAAIWCLAGTALEPVWANARARALGSGPHDLASVAGRR